jgi:hypothetical protein
LTVGGKARLQGLELSMAMWEEDDNHVAFSLSVLDFHHDLLGVVSQTFSVASLKPLVSFATAFIDRSASSEKIRGVVFVPTLCHFYCDLLVGTRPRCCRFLQQDVQQRMEGTLWCWLMPIFHGVSSFSSWGFHIPDSISFLQSDQSTLGGRTS